MIETHKIHIDDAITIILASSFYISNTSVSTSFTSVIYINFNGDNLGARSTGENPVLLVHWTPSWLGNNPVHCRE
jgi:hypothetical protein